jgi:SSS family transporter
VGFSTIDYVILVVYLAAVALFGAIAGGRQRTVSDYFLGRDSVPWWVVCFAIVAAETSTLTFISIPGLAYMTDLTFLQLTLGYLVGRIAVSFLLLPSYFAGDLSTAYAFLQRRFGPKTRSMASIVFLFTRIAADGVRLFATAIPLKLVLEVEYPVAILVLAGVAVAYTYTGGLRGVIWVDAFQMVVYLGGAVTAGIVLVAAAGGDLGVALQPAQEAGKLRFIDVTLAEGLFTRPYNLLAGIIGGAFLSMASHGTDHLIVQRVLATKSLKAGRKALIGSGVVIVFQFALFLVVGVLLYGHYGGATLSSLGLQRADEIFPRYIIEGLPSGVSGFIIAGLFAAALSTLAGSITSLSSSTVLDLIKPRMRTELSEAATLRVSRVVTIFWAGLLVLSAVFFMNTTQAVVELALGIASFTYGGLLGTFLLGVVSRHAGQEDALAGFVAGITVMVTVIALGLVAWTWYTGIGVAATLVVGGGLTQLGRGQRT